jgi:hypothetical protein
MVDLIRRQYRGMMRARENDDSSIFLVDWTFVPWGTPGLDFPASFRSSQTDPDRLDMGNVGEVRTRNYPRALTRAPAWMKGDHLCGTPEQWADGYPVGTPVPPWSGGAPVCCQPATAEFNFDFNLDFDS